MRETDRDRLKERHKDRQTDRQTQRERVELSRSSGDNKRLPIPQNGYIINIEGTGRGRGREGCSKTTVLINHPAFSLSLKSLAFSVFDHVGGWPFEATDLPTDSMEKWTDMAIPEVVTGFTDRHI